MMYNVQFTPEVMQMIWNALLERPAKEVYPALLEVREQTERAEAAERNRVQASTLPPIDGAGA